MNNINISNEEWVKTIRKLYSAVNELLDILGRDVREWGYDKEKLDRKVQAYVNYLGDTKEWEELNKREDSDEDKDLLLDKVQDDVLDIMSLSTSREDADKARKALKQLSVVTSADVMDVLNSCIEDGWKVGKSTRYAKKKLVMNSVPSIYEKEETNNWADLYYNVVHWRYQILNWDKIYTTKRGGVQKTQEVNPQESWEEDEWVSVTGEIGENIGEIPVVFKTVEVADQKEEAEEDVEKREESEGQHERADTIENQPKEENKQIEEEVEWSEKKVIEELMKIQNVEWFEELQRCNDVEIPFLAREISESPKAIELLRKISLSEGDEWNNKEINSEFKRMLDKLFVSFTVNAKYFHEWPKELGIKSNGKLKTFRKIRSDFMRELWLNGADILGLETVSEYMAFISCMNNIKNSIIETKHKIMWEGKNSLRYLLKWKDEGEIRWKLRDYLINLLRGKIKVFEDLKESSKKSLWKKMEILKMQIELDFDSLIKKNLDEYSLSKSVEDELNKLVDERNHGNINIDWLMDLFMPVFIKMWILDKAYDSYPYHWFKYVDTTLSRPIIKYVINWKTIELSISKLKDIGYKDSRLSHYYFDFKNVILYAIYKSIKENDGCPYEFKFGNGKGVSSFWIRDVYSGGDQFVENSHFGDCLKKFFDEEKRVIDGDTQIEPLDTGEFIVGQEWAEVENGDEVAETQADVGESRENREVPEVSSIEFTWEENVGGEWADNTAKDGGDEEEKPKNKKNKRQNNVFEWNDNVKNVTIEDIISFYANNDERAKLKTLKKKGGSDQRDCSKLREDYKIKIIKPGFKKWILIGLKTIADKIWERTGNKINKPYTHKWFDTIVWELARLGWKS